MAKTSPVKFIEEVRQEVSRVTWPTRKETVVTTAMVFVMVFIAAGFSSSSIRSFRPGCGLSSALDIKRQDAGQ